LFKGKISITTKWVFRIKQAKGDQKEIFKARLVARGCEQRKGIDFEKNICPHNQMGDNQGYSSIGYLEEMDHLSP